MKKREKYYWAKAQDGRYILLMKSSTAEEYYTFAWDISVDINEFSDITEANLIAPDGSKLGG